MFDLTQRPFRSLFTFFFAPWFLSNPNVQSVDVPVVQQSMNTRERCVNAVWLCAQTGCKMVQGSAGSAS